MIFILAPCFLVLVKRPSRLESEPGQLVPWFDYVCDGITSRTLQFRVSRGATAEQSTSFTFQDRQFGSSCKYERRRRSLSIGMLSQREMGQSAVFWQGGEGIE
jgi:hypothetical protein